MACRGFIRKDFPDGGSGRFRARWVKEPYDAYDESVPPNDVIFDSDAFANLPIMDVGRTAIQSVVRPNTTNLYQYPETWLKIWTPPLPFVPLCSFEFTEHFVGNTWKTPYYTVRHGGEIRVTTGGIRFGRANPFQDAAPLLLTIDWVAYAVPAT